MCCRWTLRRSGPPVGKRPDLQQSLCEDRSGHVMVLLGDVPHERAYLVRRAAGPCPAQAIVRLTTLPLVDIGKDRPK
jgi:hypothetical protein